jgi:tol-pal system protein YbgF
MKTAKLLTVAIGAASLCGLAGSAFAQDDTSRRLDRIEKELHEVRSIVLQAKATGQPVEVRTASSDDQMTSMQAKLDDIDQSVRSLTGQVEELSHDVDMAKKSAADAQTQVQALADRVDKLEKQAVAASAAPPTAAPPTATSQDNKADAGGAGDAKAAYVQARSLLLNGDYPSAATAFQAFLDTYPSDANAQAAHYWLGGIKFAQNDYQASASNLIEAIRGFPKTQWAPDAVIKLALALNKLNKSADACAALGSLGRHYPKLPAAVKTRAAAARTEAGCGASR